MAYGKIARSVPHDDEQWQRDLQTATRSAVDHDETVRESLVPGLTVLHHPQLDRVGERVELPELCSGQSVNLSRLEPTFAAPHDRVARPLGVAHLSRSPLVLRAGGGRGDIVLDPAGSPTRTLVDGEPLDAPRVIGAGRRASGVVLLLGSRVVLLLHDLDPVPPNLPRFGLVGDSVGIDRLRHEIARAASIDVPVLLRGATGVGKELVATAIHGASRRRSRRMVTVNAAAIPSTLAAAELFGAAKGAFTGADAASIGFFERADHGTLFLDEIGATSRDVQVLLLRVLESGEIQSVGGVRTRTVDTRVIAATDADLEAEIAAGGFVAPLLHRLGGYTIDIPPLCARRSDIGRLLVHFLRHSLAELGAPGRLVSSQQRPWPPAGLVADLARHDWPGNVRELRNAARRLAIAGIDDEAIDAADLIGRNTATDRGKHPSRAGIPQAEGVEGYRTRRPSTVSCQELRAALLSNRWQLGPAARKLGVSRPSLYDLIDGCPDIRKASDLAPDEIQAALDRESGDIRRAAAILEVSQQGLKRRIRALGMTP